jgi:hypothetical protein
VGFVDVRESVLQTIQGVAKVQIILCFITRIYYAFYVKSRDSSCHSPIGDKVSIYIVSTINVDAGLCVFYVVTHTITASVTTVVIRASRTITKKFGSNNERATMSCRCPIRFCSKLLFSVIRPNIQIKSRSSGCRQYLMTGKCASSNAMELCSPMPLENIRKNYEILGKIPGQPISDLWLKK